MEQNRTPSHISLILLIVALAIGPVILGAIRPWIYLPIMILLAVVFAIKLVEWKSAFPFLQRWSPDPVDTFVMLFLIYAGIRSAIAVAPYEARLEYLKIITYAGLFWTLRYGIDQRRQALLILGSVAVVALGVSGFAFFLKSNPDFHPYGETFHLHYAPRLTGTYGCPNHLGYFLVIAVTIAAAFGCLSRLPWIARILFLYGGGTMLVALVLTLSRGSWLAFLCALFIFSFFAVRLGKIRKWIPIAGFLALASGFAATIALNPSLNQRLWEGFNPGSTTLSPAYVRVQLFYDSLKINQDYPWMGTGPATFLYVHPRYQDPRYDTLAVFNHNDYLNILTDYGWIGLLLALGFITTASAQLLRRPDPEAPWHDRIPHVTGAAAMLALVLHSFVDFNLHIPANAFLFFAVVGLGLRQPEGVRRTPVLPWSKILWGPALLLLLFFIFQIQKTARGYFPYHEMHRQGDDVIVKNAVPQMLEAAKADPDSGAIATYLGDLYRSQAARTQDRAIRVPAAFESIRWYQRARELNPLDDTITLRLAMAHDLCERYMEAYHYYIECLEHQKYNGYFWTELGSHYWRRGALEKAVIAYEAALQCPYKPSGVHSSLETLQGILNEQRRNKPPHL